MFYFSDALTPQKCHYWEEFANVRSIWPLEIYTATLYRLEDIVG